MQQPIILNFDQSVAISTGLSIDLTSLQENIRFGCGMGKWRALTAHLDKKMPEDYGTVLMGSGDYHHLSCYLITRLAQKMQTPLQVVVLDNHPDNMRFPFGIHCGSWISHIAKLPCVSHVHVVGITSEDASVKHAWETRLAPLYTKKLTNWCIGVKTDWAGVIGLGDGFRSFVSKDEMLDALQRELQQTQIPTYLSIDKDVFALEVVRTNWDQGVLSEQDVMTVIEFLKPNIIGSDITGDVSIYEYQTGWKRVLSGLDAQVAIAKEDIAAWQQTQNELNEKLVAVLTV